MTTKEFIEKIRDLRFNIIDDTKGNFKIINYDGHILARVSNQSAGIIELGFSQINMLPTVVKNDLILLLGEYATTPIKDRKEPKKYRLKFQPLGLKIGSSKYLNYFKENDEYTIMDSLETTGIQTKFTEKEIDELDNKADILSTFIKEEVKEKWKHMNL